MKNKRNRGFVLSALVGLALGALTAQAQTNFYWTNTTTGFWSTNANWTNGAPIAGGGTNYVLNFLTPATTVSTTNTLGVGGTTNGFLLNSLNVSNVALTIYGSNLVFITGGAVLPTFNQNGASNVVLNLGVVLSNNTTFGGTGSGGVTLSSNVSGPGSLTKAGTNTLTLAGSNTYSGITTVTGGILRVASGGGIYNGLNNNLAGALTVTNSGVVEFASWTFGNGNSFGSLWDSAANIVVNGGTLRYIGAGNNSGNRSLTIGALGATLESFTAGQTWTIGVSDITNMISASGGLLTLTGVGNGQINQNIPGTGGLTKNGSGTWILAGSNSYSGGTIVSNGVLGVGTTNALGAGLVTWANAASVFSNTVALVGITNVFNLASNIIIDTASGDLRLSGVITNTGGLTKQGANTLTLTGANTYSGGTIITNGILVASNNNALGTGTVTITNGVTRLVIGDGMTITNNITIFGTIGVAGRGIIENSGSGSGTLSNGTITISGSPVNGGVFANAGGSSGYLFIYDSITSSVPVNLRNGTVFFGGGGSYTNFTVSQGTAKLAANNGIATNATVDVGSAAGAGTFDLAGYNQTLVGINRPAALTAIITNSSATASMLTTYGTSTYAGVIGGANLSLTVNGGQLTLTGTNTFTGDTTISAGTLVLSNWYALGGSALNYTNGSGALQFGANGTAYQWGGLKGDGNLTLTNLANAGVTLTIANAANMTYAGGLGDNSRTGVLIKAGVGNLTLAGLNTYSGGTIISNGELGVSLAANLGSGAVTLAGGLLQVNGTALNNLSPLVNWTNFNGGIDVLSPYALVTISSNLSGSSFAKTGLGFLTLSGAINTAGLSVSNGTLRLAGGSSTVALTTAVTVAGGTLDLVGSMQTNSAGVSFKGGWVRDGTLIKSGADYDAQAGVVAANLQGNVGLTKSGLGTLTLLGNNTYLTNNLNAGTLAVVSDANLGRASSVINFGGGTLQVLGTALSNLNTHTVLGTGNWNFDIVNAANMFTLSSVLSGNVSLMKTNAGTLALTGVNGYSNGTFLGGGTLNINSDAALGAVPIAPATSLTFTASGTLQAGAPALTLNNNRTLLINSGVTATLDDNGGLLTINGNVLGAGGLTKVGTGTLVLAGTNTYTGTTLVSVGAMTFAAPGTNSIGVVTVGGAGGAATLNINGPTSLGANNLTMGTAAGDRSVLIISTNFTTANLSYIGKASGAAGAVIQNGGVTSWKSTVGGDDMLSLGNSGGYGYYQMNGGQLLTGQLALPGKTGGGNGVFDLVNGTVSVNGQWLLWGWSAGNGVLNVFNGSIANPTGSNSPVTFGYTGAGNSFGMLNLLGTNAVVDTTGSVNNKYLEMMRSSGNLASVLNLNSGVLIANQIKASSTAGTFLNFNGGTLLANSGTTLGGQFLQGLAAVTIYSGGAVIDSSNSTITIAQNLLAPTGYGVTNITLAGNGAGYIGAPVVMISGGGGTGATAIAQVDLNTNNVSTYGTITNILVTSYGVGYTSTPTVSLTGGGALTAATLQSISLGMNTNSGGLTKLGSGVLTLSGTNTYGGGSIISNGLLQFNVAAALPATGTVTINALGAAAFNWAGLQNVLTTQVNNASAGAIALTLANTGDTINFNTAGLTNAFLGAAAGNTILYTGSFTPFTAGVFNLGGGNGTLIFTQAISGTALTIGTGGGQSNVVWLGEANAFTNITLNSNTTLSIASDAGAAYTLNGGTLQVRGSSLNSLNLNPSIAGNVAFDINNAGNTFTVATNLTVGGTFGKLGAGTLVLGGSNDIAGAVTISAGALRLTHGDALDGVGSNVTVAIGAALQLANNITTEAGDLLTLNGSGLANDGALRSMSGSNTWRGPIVLGSVARINADSGLLTLSSNINNGSFALTVGGAGNTLISGAITNTGILTKDGSGTLTLTGSNTYTGATTLNAGGLTLDFSQSAVANNIIATNSALTLVNGTLLVNGSGGAVTQQFNGLTIGNGFSTLTASNNGGTVVVALGAIARAAGAGVLDLNLPGGSGAITTTNVPNSSGIFDQLLTVSGTDWATTNGASPYTLVAYAGYTNVGSSIPNSALMYNLRINSSSDATLSNVVTISSNKTLLISDATAAHSLALAGTNTLMLGSPGAILLARGSGDFTVGTNVNDGYLKSSGELNLINYATSNLTINAAIVNGANALTINGTGPVNLNGTNVCTGATYINGGTVMFTSTNSLGAVNIRGGTTTFSAASSNSLGAVTVGGAGGTARLNINGVTASSGLLSLGSAAFDRAVVTVSTNLSVNQLQIGNAANGAGALFQTGGILRVTTTTDNDANFGVGNSTGGYGYYNLSGGTLASATRITIGNYTASGNGVFDMSGGLVSAPTNYVLIARGNTANTTNFGIVNVFGGTFNGSINNGIVFTYDAAAAGRYSVGQLTIANGGTVYSGPGTNQSVDVMRGAGNIGIVNLNAGGTAVVNQIKVTAAGTSVFNFNGGVLVANPGTILSNNFFSGLAAAYVYSGGAIIDSSNNNIIVGQSLLASTGYGLTSIALATNGAGYIGAPIVAISGGSGTGATAIAQGDFNVDSPTYGQVTNILITSAGSGYLPNDTVNVQLLGGGYTQAATLSNIAWAANLNNGGLTKLGTGSLTLSGANTYGGTSVISSGTLVFQPAATATNTIGGLGGSGTMLHNGLGMTILGDSSAGFTGTATINTGTVQFATLNALPTTASNGVLVNSMGVAALGFTGMDNNTLTNFNSTSAGIIAFTPASAGQTFDFHTANLSNAFFGAMNSATFGGVYTPYNNAYQFTGIRGSTLTYTNAIGAGSVTIGSLLSSVSTGTVVFTGGNSYSGATTINSGSTLKAGAVNTLSPNSLVNVAFNGTLDSAGNSQTLGSLTGNGSIINSTTNLATLTIGADNASAGFTGTIYNAHNLVKAGTGTQTIANVQAYSGSTLVSNGTLRLAAPGAPVSGSVYWLDAANSGLATGSSVSVWNDVSGNGRNFTNATAASQPIFTTNAQGQAVVRFLGANTNVLFLANAPGVQSLFIVNKETTWVNLEGIWGQYSSDNGIRTTTNSAGVPIWNKAANDFIPGETFAVNGGTFGTTASFTTNTTHLLEAIGTSASAIQTQSLGIHYTATARPYYGDISEVVAYGSALTEVQRRQIELYLMSKWGLGAANVLPVTTILSLANGSTLDLNGINQAIAGLSDFTPGSTGFITNGASAVTSILTIAPAAGSNYTFSGNINDGGSANAITLTMNGPGTQILAGNNTYSGGTVINTGVLQFAAATAVSPNSNITINVGGAAAFDYAPFQNQLTNMATTSAGSIALTTNSAGANLDFNTLNLSNAYLGAVGAVTYTGTYTNFGTVTRLGGGGGTLTFNQAITNGSVAIGNGLGTVILNNNNSYTGTVINAGILQVLADTNLGAFVVGQTNITFAGNSTLQAGAPGITLNANRTILVASNAFGTVDNNGYNSTINGNIIGTNGTLVLVGSGTNNIGGLANTVFGIMANNGTTVFAPNSTNIIASGNNSVSYGLQVAPNAGNRAVVTFNPTAGQTNIILGSLRVGNATNAAGAVYQTSGVVLQNGVKANQDFAIGSAGGYGYYLITGGTVIANQMEVAGNQSAGTSGGVGVMDIYGGTVAPQDYFLIGRSVGGIGVVNVANGGVLASGSAINSIGFGWDATAEYGVLNILNGGLVNGSSGSKNLDFSPNGLGNTGIVNLNSGGTAILCQITNTKGSTGIFNFNGGLLVTTNAGATLINNNLTAVNVYQGGANISNSVSTAILQPLLAPAGSGVTNIVLLSAGTNYIGAPAIKITGGTGQGATAIAQVDATGVITNILITSAGYGYQANDVLTAQLLGGGATLAGALGTVILGANVSGGLTKYGAGTLTLGGNNTYTDCTSIVTGNLQLGNNGASGSLANPTVVFSNAASWLGFNRTDQFTNSLAVQTPNGYLAALVQNGANILVLTNTAPVYNSTIISNGAVFFASTSAIPNKSVSGVISLASGGGVAIGGAFTSVTNLLTSGLLTNNMNSGTLALMTGGNNENISLGAYTNLFLGTAPGQVATFLGTLTPATGTTNLLVRSGAGGTLIIGGNNIFTDAGSLTNRALVVGSVGSNSTVQILGPQSYSGGTTITNAMLSVSADNNLGYGGITLQAGGALQITNALNNSFTTIKPVTLLSASSASSIDVGGAVTSVFYGAFSGSGFFHKTGSGTLALAGAFNAAAGAAAINNFYGGTLWLMGGSSLNNGNGATDINLWGGTTMQVDSNATAYLNNLNLGNTSGTVTYNQTGGSVTTKQAFIIGKVAGSIGTVTMTGGSLVFNSNNGAFGLEVGSTNSGTLNITNATITGVGTGGNGSFYVARNTGASGTVNQGTGSVVNISAGSGGLVLGPVTNTSATYNLGAGGLLVTPKISSGYAYAGTPSQGVWKAAFNFNGGTLVANANSTTFMQGLSSVSNLSGGAFIDSSNFFVTVSNNLVGTGALTKLGNGTLMLAGSNTYNKTTINAGTVWFASTNAIAGASAANATQITNNYGGTLAAAGAYTNVMDWLNSGRIATNSAGAIGMLSNNSETITMGVFSNLYLGVVAFSNVQYSGTLTPTNGAYRLTAGYLATNTMLSVNALSNASTYGLLVAGPGLVVLAQSNSYTGGTLIQSGATLLLSTNVAAGTGKITNNFGGVLVAGYALDQTTLTNMAAASAGVVALGTNSSSNLDFNAPGLANVSLGAVGVRTNSGTLTPYGSTYMLGGGGGTLVITNNTLTNLTANLVAFGGGTGGTLILTGSNTYNGGTLMTNGTVTAANVNALGTGSVTVNGGTLNLTGVGTSGFGTLTIGASGTVVANLTAGSQTNVNAIQGSGLMVVTNAGNFILSGSNSFSGTYQLLGGGGAVVFNALNAAAGAPNLVFAGGYAAISDQMVGTNIMFSSLSGTGKVDTAYNSVTGVYVAGTRTLYLMQNTNTLYWGALADTSNNRYLGLTKDGVGTLTLSGSLSAYTGLTTVNNGILALSNTTAWASPVTINGGQLLLMTPTAVQNVSITNNANDGLGFTGGNAFTLGGLAGSGGITLWSGTGGGVTLTIGSNNISSTYSGVLSDAGPGNYFQGSLIKVGTGTLTLSGANTYNGRTTVAGTGYLVVGNNLALGTTNGDTVVNSGAMLQLTNGITVAGETVYLAGGGTDFYGALQAAANSTGTWTGPVVLNDALVRIGAQSNGMVIVSGPIVNGVGTNLTISGGSGGGGVVTISGTNNTYSGITGIGRGTLKLGATDALPTGTILDMHPLAATDPSRFDLAGFNQTVSQLKDTDFTGGRLITNSTAGLSILTVNQAATTTYSGLLAGGNLGLTKSGTGALTLSGANTYSGGTTNSAGTLSIGHVNALGTGALTMNGGQLNIVADLSAGNGVTNAITLGADSTINFPALALTNSVTFSGVIGNDGTARNLTFASASRSNVVVTLNAVNTYGGNTTFTRGASQCLSINLGVDNALPTNGVLTFDDASQPANNNFDLKGYKQTIGGLTEVSGPRQIKSTVAGGVLTINVAGGGDYTFSGQNDNISGSLRIVKNGAGIQRLSTGTVNAGGGQTWSDGTWILGGTLVSGPNGIGSGIVAITNGQLQVTNYLTITSNLYGNSTATIDLNNGVLSNVFNSTSSEFAGAITNTGSFYKGGSGTLTLSGANTYSGDTTISAGTLQMGTNAALPSTTTLKADNLGATLDLNGYAQEVHGVGGVTGLGFNGTITNSGAESTLTVNFASGTTNNFLGVLNGPGNLTLIGGGTLLMTGTNNFTGALGTIVSNATYTVNGLHNGAIITAYSNSTVGGSGPISGTLLVNGGTYQPGGSVLTQAVATLILTNSSTLAVTLAQTNNPAYVTVSSQLTLAGTNNYLRLSNPDSLSYTAGTITLVDYRGTGVLDFTNNYFRLADNINTIVGPNDGWALTNNMQFSVVGGGSVTNLFTINYDDLANGVITLTAVPEPGTASLLGLIGVAFLVRGLRRRTQKT